MFKSYIVFLLLNFITLTYGQTVAPGTWSDWVDNSCTDTCGMCGVVQQIRICLSLPCNGPGTQNTTRPCGSPVCIIPRPACCPGSTRGVQNGQIACISNNGPVIGDNPLPTVAPVPGGANQPSTPAPGGEDPTPSPAPGTWTEWFNDGCTDTCGMCGFQRKSRTCLVPNTCM
uniref:Uncharacterized protein n=1 Tax=Acrobeloides nanus TaxID=290746 RepID=A0A914C1N7_9BILA